MRFPFAKRTTLCCHAQFRPSGTTALAAAACFVECGGVPFGAGAAGGFALGEDFRWGDGEICLSESMHSNRYIHNLLNVGKKNSCHYEFGVNDKLQSENAPSFGFSA